MEKCRGRTGFCSRFEDHGGQGKMKLKSNHFQNEVQHVSHSKIRHGAMSPNRLDFHQLNCLVSKYQDLLIFSEHIVSILSKHAVKMLRHVAETRLTFDKYLIEIRQDRVILPNAGLDFLQYWRTDCQHLLHNGAWRGAKVRESCRSQVDFKKNATYSST